MYNVILESAFRGLVAYLLLLIVARLMGRKAIAQMTFFDFVVAIMLGSLGANLGMGGETSAQSAATVIITLAVLAITTGYIHIKSFTFNKVVNSEPVIVIENGKINEENMKKIRFTLTELTAMLRKKKIFNLADVEFALLETDGKISVLPKSQKQPVTPSDLNISTPYKGLSKDLIIDGVIIHENLYDANLDEVWLMGQLKNYNVSDVNEVFYASLDTQGNLYVSKKNIKSEEHGKYGIE